MSVAPETVLAGVRAGYGAVQLAVPGWSSICMVNRRRARAPVLLALNASLTCIDTLAHGGR